jgi:hypothetical protein
VFNNVPPDDLIEFVIRKWIRQIVQIVDNVSSGSRVDIHTNCAMHFVGAATDIKHPRLTHFSIRANFGLRLDMLGFHPSRPAKQMESR